MSTYYKALSKSSAQKWALSPKYKEAGIEPEKLGEFAKKVGAQTKLEPKKQTIPYKHPEKDKLRGSGNRNDNEINEDYDIPELDVLLDRSVLSKSKLVWGTMNESSEKCLCAHYRSNASHYTKTANSSLVWKLRTHRWVPQKQEAEGKFLFVKPSDAVAELLPNGFSFDNGAKWLEAIEFGKSERDREELERHKQEQNSQNHQRQETAAKEIGFSSVEEVQEAKEMMELKQQDPEGFKKWQDSNKEKARFPTSPVRNPERREERLAEQNANATEKKYKRQEKSDRTTRREIDPNTWLKNKYTNESNQMICQICKEEMPFRKRDGEYYFESVEALSREYFPKEQKAQFLALCPVCAARYKEFVKRDETTLEELYHALKNSDELEVLLTLGEWETSIRFVETHHSDIKTSLRLSPSP